MGPKPRHCLTLCLTAALLLGLLPVPSAAGTEDVYNPYPRKILKKEITVKYCRKNYDGTCEAQPDLTVTVLAGDEVTITAGSAVFSDPYAGANKTLTISDLCLGGKDAEKYYLEDEALVLTADVGEIVAQEPKAVDDEIQVAAGQSLDLMTQLTGAMEGCVSFTLLEDSTSACTLEGTTLTAGETKGTVTLLAQCNPYDVNGDGKPEYASGCPILTISIRDKVTQPSVIINPGSTEETDKTDNQKGETAGKETQSDFLLRGSTSVTYGQQLQLSASGGSGSGQVTFSVEEWGDSGGSAVITDAGLLTATHAGKVLVRATKAGDATHEARKADPIEVTILPASLTIRVHDKTAAVGDAVPTFSARDWSVSGLVGSDTLARSPTLSYASTPDLSREGTVQILAKDAQPPAGGNYEPIAYLPGTLTITARPVYPITVRSPLNGTLTADRTTALEGDTVTLTAVPSKGFLLDKVTALQGSRSLTLREKSDGVYTFTMPGGGVTASAVFTQEEVKAVTLPFTDVLKQLWYYDSVAYVYEHGLMNGTSATTFGPNLPTTRAMIVTILYRLAGSPAGAAWSPFADVAADAYYAAPVAWAAWNGIVNGYNASSFGPKDWITREQLAAILYRYAEKNGWDVSQRGDLSRFSDTGKCSAYAKTALAWATGAGLIEGKSNGKLDPRGLASRAQAAAILQRFHQLIPAAEAESTQPV